jgi:hypothetical protein
MYRYGRSMQALCEAIATESMPMAGMQYLRLDTMAVQEQQLCGDGV